MLNWTRNFIRTRGGSFLSGDSIARPAEEVLSGPPTTGDLLGRRYHLIDLIGQGATSVVYRAADTVAAEDVAIKILLRREADSSQGPADERSSDAAVALRLTHPNITRVFELDMHERWPFIVMEYLAGCDLHRHAKRTREHRLPLQDILRIGTSCLDALSYAHSHGVVHNDVKPSNLLLLPSGAVKLCDFGLARLAEGSPGAWLTMSSAGAPAFMSPERIKGDPCAPRSDLYSVGATLYTLAAGRTLFGAEMAQAWRGHLELEPPPSPYVPPPLFAVLKTALSKDPRARYESAAQMHAALIEAFGDMDDDLVEDVIAPSPRRPNKTPPPMFRPTMRSPPEGMVRVPQTLVRSKHGGDHHVHAFFMQKAPVTNAEWKEFIVEVDETPPSHWLGGRVPLGREKHPVVGVTLEDARRYASWARMRLPSDIEWEAAARGEEGRAFPWGAYYESARVNGPESGRNDTAPIDTFRSGDAACGCIDMIGNVWEWSEPQGSVHAADPGYAWVFGGSYRHACSQEGGIARTAVAMDKDYLYLGFRCARDEGTSS